MKTTWIRRFTLAFIVSDGACQPVWDNGDPLTGASEEAAAEGQAEDRAGTPMRAARWSRSP
jgi:hypothetical protein